MDRINRNAAGTAVSGLQALPNAASSDGSSFYAFNSKLTSAGGAVVGENGGRTVVNLISTECTAGGETAISASGSSAGILTVNLWDTALTGGIECGKNCSVTVNLYAGGKLSGEVSGEGTVEINVFDGGEYTGSFAANAAGAGEPAPIPGTFDDYLVNCWATGSSTWTESRAQQYVTKVEPAILENSAACLVADGAAAKAYDPAVYNPSETGVDLSLLNVGGAHGFTVEEIFGSGTEMPEGFSGFPDAPGDGFGESSGAPAGGNTAAKAGMGDSPAAVIIYRNDQSSSPNADFDCGLAVQNMAIAAASMGYGVKIISSPTMTLNGANHDAICEKLGVDASLQAVAVLLIGTSDNSEDAVSGASTRDSLETRTTIIE